MKPGRKRRISLRMTRETALRYGLLTCKCGHPDTNHFDHDKNPCAHCECKHYEERARIGMTLVAESP